MGNREQEEHFVLLSGVALREKQMYQGCFLVYGSKLFRQAGGGGNLASACMPATSYRSTEAEVSGSL